jgi:hypothetical protein
MFALSVANRYETEWNKLSKEELSAANNAFWSPAKLLKVKTFKTVSETTKIESFLYLTIMKLHCCLEILY